MSSSDDNNDDFDLDDINELIPINNNLIINNQLNNKLKKKINTFKSPELKNVVKTILNPQNLNEYFLILINYFIVVIVMMIFLMN